MRKLLWIPESRAVNGVLVTCIVRLDDSVIGLFGRGIVDGGKDAAENVICVLLGLCGNLAIDSTSETGYIRVEIRVALRGKDSGAFDPLDTFGGICNKCVVILVLGMVAGSSLLGLV